MQFSQTIVLMAMAISSVAAVPTPNSTPAPTCPSGSSELCCDTGALLGLTCILSSILGSTCTTETICCTDNGGTQTCTNTDGTVITLPITISIPINL